MLINTKYRTDAVEIMDDFDLEGNQLRDALDKIASINQLLGGNKLTLQGLQLVLKAIPKNSQNWKTVILYSIPFRIISKTEW